MQQVNLYSEILKQQGQQSSTKLIGFALGIVGLLFLLFSVYLILDIKSTESQVEKAQQALNQQQARFNEILSKRPKQEPDQQLIADIDEWRNNVNEAAQAIQMLVGKEAVLLKGFSSYLRAFAAETNPEVWLTTIHIDGQNEDVRLEGSTFKPQQIPYTLQQLQNRPALKGLTFGKLIMEQSPNVPGQMDFILSSPVKPSDAQDHAQ
jgi:Tfp pilus assembly protein PilN